MNHTQHFHPSNLQFLAAEARREAAEFPQRPAAEFPQLPALSQPKFTSSKDPAIKFLLAAEHAAERVALALRSSNKGCRWLGLGQNPASGTPVAVVTRKSGRTYSLEV